METPSSLPNDDFQSSINAAAFLSRNGKNKLSVDLIVETLKRLDLEAVEASETPNEDIEKTDLILRMRLKLMPPEGLTRTLQNLS